MATNNFLPFCPNDTGTNLETQSTYAADSSRTNGNQPGVASSKLNNKALRQGTAVVAEIAQYMANVTGADVLDDGDAVKMLGLVTATFKRHVPVITKYSSGSGSHNLTYKFAISSGSATVGATYTNNSVTYTVSATVATAVQVNMTGNGAPTVSGTLTKTGGTGDATLTFYAVNAPLYINILALGGGGGGGGSVTTSTSNGGTGGNTTWGSTVVVANGGIGGNSISGSSTTPAGGTASLGTGAIGNAVQGGTGGGGIQISTTTNVTQNGGYGAASPLGGAGAGGTFIGSGVAGNGVGNAAIANSGSGGGGAGNSNSVASVYTGGGGGAGGYANANINAPTSTTAYAIGTAGTAGSAGTSGAAGGAGGSGVLIVTEFYS